MLTPMGVGGTLRCLLIVQLIYYIKHAPTHIILSAEALGAG